MDPASNTTTATVTVVTLASTTIVPTASPAKDDVTTTPFETAIALNVLANDATGYIVDATFTQPTNGGVTRSGDVFTYTPATGWSGLDSFTYGILDPGGSGTVYGAVATVITFASTAPIPAIAKSDAITADYNSPVTITVLFNDLAGATLTGTMSTPNSGTVAIVGSNIVYTPDDGHTGLDSFTYEATLGGNTDSAEVFVFTEEAINPLVKEDVVITEFGIAVNILPLANDLSGSGIVLTGDFTQPSNGTVTYDNNVTLTYTPVSTWSGLDTFTYEVEDDNGRTAIGNIYVYTKPAIAVIGTPSSITPDYSIQNESPVNYNITNY